jgi:hypothetical protein
MGDRGRTERAREVDMQGSGVASAERAGTR